MSGRIPNENLPYISALLVTRNEQDYIEMALMSYINQDYPKNKYEILVVDGGSTDATMDIVRKMKRKYEDTHFSITILDNPKQILASGWNVGIQAAKGEYVIRIDAHAKAERDFLYKSAETILQVDAVCVGGKLVTKTLGDGNGAISKVLSSPFGVGNSSFRVSERSGFVDTAVYGLYKKSIFQEVGYFEEKYVRNQDLQMHARIRKHGGRFYFNPDIRCEYYARNTTKKMVRQGFQNGKWNMILLKEDRSGLSIRHLVPFTFVLFLIAAGAGGFVYKPLWILQASVLLLHLLLGVYFGIRGGAKGKEALVMPFLFLLLHISYGSGFLVGVLK